MTQDRLTSAGGVQSGEGPRHSQDGQRVGLEAAGGGARGHALVHLDRARYEETEALEATLS